MPLWHLNPLRIESFEPEVQSRFKFSILARFKILGLLENLDFLARIARMTRILGIDWLVFYLICKNMTVEFILSFDEKREVFALPNCPFHRISCYFLFMLRKWCWRFHGMMSIIARFCCIDLSKRFAWVVGVVCMKILTNGEIES